VARTSVRRPVRRPNYPAPVVVLTCIAAAFLVFTFGAAVLAPLLRWWEESTAPTRPRPSVVASRSDEILIWRKATPYAMFTEEWTRRVELIPVRYGWDQEKFQQARRELEALRPTFELVHGLWKAWGEHPIADDLAREVFILAEQIATFCDRFGLVCRPGVLPDEACFKPCQPTVYAPRAFFVPRT